MRMEKELPERKTTRLKKYDYSSRGAYFITVCTENRENSLSSIVGEGSSLPKLTKSGEVVEKWIISLSEKYPEVNVDCYVIMPNHIHLLISIARKSGREDPSPTVNSIVGWLKYQSTVDINNTITLEKKKIFQRSFYDHVVRNNDDYREIYKYICENPRNWYFDKLYNEK